MTMNNDPFLEAIRRDYFNANPSAAFQAFFQPQLQSPNRNYASFLQGLGNQYQQEYSGAVGNNPNLTFLDFLGTKDPMRQFQNLAPRLRGENPGMMAPRANYKFGVGY